MLRLVLLSSFVCPVSTNLTIDLPNLAHDLSMVSNIPQEDFHSSLWQNVWLKMYHPPYFTCFKKTHQPRFFRRQSRSGTSSASSVQQSRSGTGGASSVPSERVSDTSTLCDPGHACSGRRAFFRSIKRGRSPSPSAVPSGSEILKVNFTLKNLLDFQHTYKVQQEIDPEKKVGERILGHHRRPNYNNQKRRLLAKGYQHRL